MSSIKHESGGTCIGTIPSLSGSCQPMIAQDMYVTMVTTSNQQHHRHLPVSVTFVFSTFLLFLFSFWWTTIVTASKTNSLNYYQLWQTYKINQSNSQKHLFPCEGYHILRQYHYYGQNMGHFFKVAQKDFYKIFSIAIFRDSNIYFL